MKLHSSTDFSRGAKARKFAATLAVITLVALWASGCSSSASPTVSQTPSSTPSPTLTDPPLAGAEALAAFKAIAEASVAKADAGGLMQTTVNSKYGDYILVLDRNYNKDYQAAVKNADGTYELIYEADAFAPAAAVSAIDLGATVAYADGIWSLTEQIEGTPTTYNYRVANGLIVSESGSSGQDSWVSNLVYGMTADGHAIIDQALKTLNG
jgi:hypothetical protein